MPAGSVHDTWVLPQVTGAPHVAAPILTLPPEALNWVPEMVRRMLPTEEEVVGLTLVMVGTMTARSAN